MDENVIGLVAVILLFGGGTLFLLAISPVGKALAARILKRGTPGAEDDEVREELKRLRSEMEELKPLRGEVAELAERVDFTERLLAKSRDAERLAPPS